MTEEQGRRIISLLNSINVMMGVLAGLVVSMGIVIIINLK